MTTMPWRRRAAIGLAVGLAATLTVELGYLGVAQAAEDPSIGKVEYTGTPMTDSAVTLKGDAAFPKLEVTVSQTRELTNQAVTVTWKGMDALVNEGRFYENYLTIMQCWGDDPTAPAGAPAPARETCQYGAFDSFGIDKDPGGLGYTRTRTVLRRDAAEAPLKGPDGQPLRYFVSAENTQGGSVPFWPVTSGWPAVKDGEKPARPKFGQSIDQGGGGVFGYTDTNEVPYAQRRVDGTGEEQFELQTSLESPSLGCGAPVGDAAEPVGRSCWLVVVPRGTTDDGAGTGTVIGPGGKPNISTSPLTASAWAHKLAFRMDFRPVGESCPLGSAQRRIVGSEVAKTAFVNWAPELCGASNVPYSLTTISESIARTTIVSSIPGSTRAALVSRPLRRDPDHPISYAPVALSGVAVGFNFERLVKTGPDTPAAETAVSGTRLPRLNLTPRILAKLLTESYGRSVPVADSKTNVPPEHLADNPTTLFNDPDVLAINPEVKWLNAPPYEAASAAPLTILENSDVTWTLWQWINADPDARKFLDGTPDQWGMTVNPNYKSIALPIENFPKSDPTCTPLTEQEKKDGATPLCVIDRAPYVENLSDAARRTRAANPGGIGSRWMLADDQQNLDPNNNPTYARWKKNTPHPPGSRFVMSITTTSEAARYGLQTAALRNGAGVFVAPDEPGLQAGASAMVPSEEDSRVLVPDPASTVPNAYPLPLLTYSAVAVKDIDTATDATARTELANFVEYVSGPGQIRGLAFGQLPPGYSPLPFQHRLQARRSVEEIKSGVVSGYTDTIPPPPADPGEDPGDVPPLTDGDVPGPTGGGGVPDGGSAPSPGPAPAVSQSSAPAPVPVVQAGRTPDDPGVMPPWVLLVGLLAGLAAAVAAPLVRPRSSGTT